MYKLLATAVLVFAACGGGSKSSTTTTPQQNSSNMPMLDPTLPSWAPPSCAAYHKVAVEALGCGAIEQGKRDDIQRKYGEASKAWKAELNADSARVNEISLVCEQSSASVHAEIAGNCAEAK